MNKVRFVQSNNIYPIKLSASKNRPISPMNNVQFPNQGLHNNVGLYNNVGIRNNNLYINSMHNNSKEVNDKIAIG